MILSERLEVVCDTTVHKNETDEELKRHRFLANRDGQAYDASVDFSVFVDNQCIRFDFNLFGLDVHHTFCLDETNTDEILSVIKVVCDWFVDKTIDDICEDFYRRIKNELGAKILAKMDEIEKRHG